MVIRRSVEPNGATRDGISVKWRFTVQKARTALPYLLLTIFVMVVY